MLQYRRSYISVVILRFSQRKDVGEAIDAICTELPRYQANEMVAQLPL